MKNQANMAADQRMPTMFETTRLWSLKRRSGISGECTLDSRRTKIANRPIAAPSTPSVWAEVQPFSFPLTIA